MGLPGLPRLPTVQPRLRDEVSLGRGARTEEFRVVGDLRREHPGLQLVPQPRSISLSLLGVCVGSRRGAKALAAYSRRPSQLNAPILQARGGDDRPPRGSGDPLRARRLSRVGQAVDAQQRGRVHRRGVRGFIAERREILRRDEVVVVGVLIPAPGDVFPVSVSVLIPILLVAPARLRARRRLGNLPRPSLPRLNPLLLLLYSRGVRLDHRHELFIVVLDHRREVGRNLRHRVG
mmetsp:Transcript_13400/g.56686  ORF Transcript_13400/g.56686 Transcript_13400/m.56686 type:complete len:234 (-) Transcript_13400:1734-2435(-)